MSDQESVSLSFFLSSKQWCHPGSMSKELIMAACSQVVSKKYLQVGGAPAQLPLSRGAEVAV